MSDVVSQARGWWLAADGKWYPPHLHPEHVELEPAAELALASAGAAQSQWWLASDGRWYPPETHPAVLQSAAMDPALAVAAKEAADAETPTAGEGLAALPSSLRSVYLVLAVVVAAYVLSVIAREGHADSRVVDVWGVGLLEIALSLLCVARAALRVQGRAVAVSLGCALMAWSGGNLVQQASAGPRPPIVADALELCFFPLAYMAVVLLMRKEVAQLGAPGWLDGAVAGLGAAAVCAALAFRNVAGTGGPHSLTTALNVVYPIGDLLLLGLVVGGTALLSSRKKTTWLLVATACSINALSDTFNLVHATGGLSLVAQSFKATAWPVAALFMSLAVWLQRPTDGTPSADTHAREVSPGFALPGLSAAAGLVIVTVGSVRSMGPVALGLAEATLFTAGVRLMISVGALRTVTQQRHRQSLTDELTGLGNRRYLSQVFDKMFGAVLPTDRAAAVLFVDLDGFKEVNDSFGHAAGDALLKQIGPRLTSSLRRADVLVRLGGDEFAVILPGTDAKQALAVADRIAASLDQPFPLDVLPIRLSASIGIAVSPGDASDLESLLRCADAAMYRAKLSRTPCQIYDPAIDDSGDLVQLMDELRRAVDAGQLVLHFQPQLDLRSGSISAVEALVRWQHPKLGLIPPLKFLPLAEEAGLMPAITARVLDDALEQSARWREQGHLYTVAVNVSPTNLLAPGFSELVRSTLARHGMPGEALVLEITETCIISDFDQSRQVIRELEDLGVVTSIDDFGAGFTSLAHLANLSVKELKLDSVFVAGLAAPDGKRDVELLRSTIALGHALGLRVVAEGIEDDDTLQMLFNFGCDIGQGYLISRPVPAESVEEVANSIAGRRAPAGNAGEVPSSTPDLFPASGRHGTLVGH